MTSPRFAIAKLTFARLLTGMYCLLIMACEPDSRSSDSFDAIVHDFLVAGLIHYQHDQQTHLYIGDPALQEEAARSSDSLENVIATMAQLRTRLNALPPATTDFGTQRRRDLRDRLLAFETRGQILLGNGPDSFDAETRALFDVQVPEYPEAHFLALTEELETLIPGETPLTERLELFREQFVIPPERLTEVIGTAMEECRRRTKAHIALPEDERVTLHIARNQPFVGFTFYRGNNHSEVHLNADVPVHIERAIELGCHEGYPGHHVHATLLEQSLIKERGLDEYSLISLFGPVAVMAEGAASHAIDLAFTREERFMFERDTLLPLAGLNSANLETYYRYIDLIEALNYARNVVARMYLYDGMPREKAVSWLMTFGLETRGTAEQRLNFIDAMRSYVVTYNYGRDLVERYISERTREGTESSWNVFEDILTRPIMPADANARLLNASSAH